MIESSVSRQTNPSDARRGASGLMTSGDLKKATLLNDRLFDYQEWDGQAWQDKGRLALFENTGFLNDEKLHNIHYHKPTSSVHYSFGKQQNHRASRLFFTDDHQAFTGTAINASGKLVAVRGNARETSYDLERRELVQQFTAELAKTFWNDYDSGKADDSKLLAQLKTVFTQNGQPLPSDTQIGSRQSKTAWQLTSVTANETVVVLRAASQVTAYKPHGEFAANGSFSLGTEWVGEGSSKHLKSLFKLGDKDISDRTAVVGVQQWQTVIAMMPSSNPMGDQDQFSIQIDSSGHTLLGTYTDAAGLVYDWKGTAHAASLNTVKARPADFLTRDRPHIGPLAPAMAMTSAVRAASVTGPDLSVGDLMNVSSITEVVVDGQPKVLDTAQTQTGKYFQAMLVNSLEDKWVNDFFGSRTPVPANVQKIMDNNADFFKKKSVMNLGQMIHDVFSSDARNKDTVKRIDATKLSNAWSQLGTDPGYIAQSSPLYVEGYRAGVPGIQPYLDNNPKQWAQKLFDQLMSDDFLNVWAVQVANQQFKNVKQQMYEWYVQLSVLDPDDTDRPQRLLSRMFAVIIGSNFNKMSWDQDLVPYLKQSIQNMLDGKASSFSDDMVKQNAQAYQEAMRGMVSAFETSQLFADQFVTALNMWALRNKGRAAVGAGDDVYVAMADGIQDAATRTKWESFKSVAPKVLGCLLYGAAAGYLIYKIVDGAGLSPIEDLNLALLATGFLVKGVEKLLATGLGDWIHAKVSGGTGGLSNFAEDLTKWFSEDGVVAESWATKFFGKNSAEFFAERLGPALALVGLALSAYDLYKAIKSGDTRDIIFQSLNTFLALGAVVFLGLELASFAWAGPVGIAIAVIGLIIAAIQLIWNLIDPPPPPPDPIAQFVDGPLKLAGFVTA